MFAVAHRSITEYDKRSSAPKHKNFDYSALRADTYFTTFTNMIFMLLILSQILREANFAGMTVVV